MKINNHTVIIVLLVIIFVAGGFFAGMQYQRSQRGTDSRFFTQANRRGAAQNGNARPVAGQILSSDVSSVTVKMPDGSSKIVILSGSTQITEATSAGKEALQSGKNILVFGNQNSDGSVTATNIQIGGMIGMFGARGGQRPNSQ